MKHLAARDIPASRSRAGSAKQSRLQSLHGTTGIILAGGLGSRLRPAVSDRPKPIALVNGRPFLDYQISQLGAAGIQEVILCVGYEAQTIVETFGASQHGVSLRYLRDWPLRGTGGALRSVLSVANAARLLVVNGDSYSNVDLTAFAERHAAADGARCTMMLSWREDRSACGGVDLDDEGRITAFREKQQGAGPGHVNAGMYLLDRTVLAEIPANRVISLERQVLPKLVGQGLYGWVNSEEFIDIGTPENYRRAQTFMAEDYAS